MEILTFIEFLTNRAKSSYIHYLLLLRFANILVHFYVSVLYILILIEFHVTARSNQTKLVLHIYLYEVGAWIYLRGTVNKLQQLIFEWSISSAN